MSSLTVQNDGTLYYSAYHRLKYDKKKQLIFYNDSNLAYEPHPSA